jgi:S1-C subfamily serine protease
MAMSKYQIMRLRIILLLIIGLAVAGCQQAVVMPTQKTVTEQAVPYLVQVTVTSQGYNFHRPWQQRRPTTQSALGVIVGEGRVLVNGLLVANHRYIELETLDNRRKHRAEVEVVDYEANLALLQPTDPEFLADRPSLELTTEVREGDLLNIWQAKPNGDVVSAEGKVTSVELSAFTQDNYFLVYRLDGALQYRGNNVTLPVIKAGKLAGLLLRYASRDRAIDVISMPVIRHFLEDVRQGEYRGFPRAGFHFGETIDPQLRRYIELPQKVSGIYVQKVIKGGPADRAGVQAGDVVTHMGTFALSDTGQYEDPLFGKTSVLHLIRTGYQVGERMPLRVFRKGQLLDLEMVLDHRTPDQYLVPPYIIDQRPEYMILGGLVLQELSLSYLREYGNEWNSDAPIHLLFYNQNQDYLNGDQGEKIVIVSGVVPTPYTIGYENLSNLVVQRINDRRIGRLSDVRAAIERPLDGFHKIEVEQHPRIIYVDPEEIPKIDAIIEQRYRIPVSSVEAGSR